MIDTLADKAPGTIPPPTFVAINFETADYGRDGACALVIHFVQCTITELLHDKHPKPTTFSIPYHKLSTLLLISHWL